MDQYLNLCRRVLDQGVWTENRRTGKRCLTVIDANLEYDVSDGTVPILTTKKVAWKSAIAEMLGYLRGYRSAAQFRALGTKTWDANANENAQWLANPHRRGTDDMGRVYGVQGRGWRRPNGTTVDQLAKIVADLSRGIDDRREILTFWNPGELELGCLPACLHTHTFSILGDRLYLTSYQRSADLPLGVPFNLVQVAWLLLVMARIAGLRPAVAYHKLINVHIYEDQIEPLREIQMRREPGPLPRMTINDEIRTLQDLETWVTVQDFRLEGYDPHPPIRYPFSV